MDGQCDCGFVRNRTENLEEVNAGKIKTVPLLSGMLWASKNREALT